MGQHKHNPTAIAAKNGELPPKPKPMGKRDIERMVMREIKQKTRMNIWSGLEWRY